MRPTFSAFETAKTAVFVNQKSIDIVGNNLANSDTNGYTRQRVDRTSIATNSYQTKVASSQIGLSGQGVQALGVSQTRDAFLDKCFRDEYSKNAYHSQATNLLSDIQSALGDGNDITDEAGLYYAIVNISNSINDFMQAPTQDTEANLVLSSFKNICSVLQQLDVKMDDVAKQYTQDLGITVDRVNEIMSQIAHYNEMIAADATVVTNSNTEYFRPNELYDERNLLLDELAGYGNIAISEQSNGMVNVTLGDMLAVDGKKSAALIMSENPDDDTVSVKWRTSGDTLGTTQGSILASLNYINGRGVNMTSSNETNANGILYYRDCLDTFANNFARMVNSSIPIYDETTGKPAVDINGSVIYKTLIGERLSDGTINSIVNVTASGISISNEWSKGGAGYFIYRRDESVGEYAQNIAYNLTDKSRAFQSTTESFTGTFVQYEIDFISKVGTELAYQTGRQEATSLVADDFLTQRDDVSGVSSDEETADMLKYQKSYEAAARFMTTLDDMLDVIINRMGRVGL